MYMTNNLIDNAARQAIVLGEQRGRQEGRQEILLKMLHKGLPIDQVAELDQPGQEGGGAGRAVGKKAIA